MELFSTNTIGILNIYTEKKFSLKVYNYILRK